MFSACSRASLRGFWHAGRTFVQSQLERLNRHRFRHAFQRKVPRGTSSFPSSDRKQRVASVSSTTSPVSLVRLPTRAATLTGSPITANSSLPPPPTEPTTTEPELTPIPTPKQMVRGRTFPPEPPRRRCHARARHLDRRAPRLARTALPLHPGQDRPDPPGAPPHHERGAHEHAHLGERRDPPELRARLVRVEREQPERRQADHERRHELERDVEEEVMPPHPPVGPLQQEGHGETCAASRPGPGPWPASCPRTPSGWTEAARRPAGAVRRPSRRTATAAARSRARACPRGSHPA